MRAGHIPVRVQTTYNVVNYKVDSNFLCIHFFLLLLPFSLVFIIFYNLYRGYIEEYIKKTMVPASSYVGN